MGSHHQDEALGADHELPPDRAYSETCAGIASTMLSWRLLLADGDARYADLIERTLLNVVLASPREDGRAFFYTNTLHQRTEGTVPFSSPSYVGPIGYGRPKPTYDMLEETDLIVFVGTVPGDVVTNGFTIRQNWDKKNFLVTIDPSLRGRSGPVSH